MLAKATCSVWQGRGPLWWSTSWSEFSGKCWGREIDAKVDRESRNDTHQHILYLEKIPTDPCPSSTCPKISQ